MTTADTNHSALSGVPPQADDPRRITPVLGALFRPVQGPMTLGRFAFGVFAGLVVLASVATLDLITGPNIFLGPVYLFGVVVAAWFGGRWAGHFLNVVTTAVWMWTVFVQRPAVSSHVLHFGDTVWNLLIRLAFFASITEVLVLLQGIERRLERVVDERTVSLRQEIIERKRAESSLHKLAAQLSAAEDAERRRVAYDIHDALSQMLGLAKLNLETTVAETAIDSRQYTRLVDVVKIVDTLIGQTRDLTFDLHPSMLDHFGLVPTLRRFGEDYGRQTLAEIVVNEIGQGSPMSTMLCSYLFRAVKEVVYNSVKHGNARQIQITFHWSEGQSRIVVDDDGCGFDTVAALAPQVRRGLGLAGITERLTSLGGKLRVESQQDTGTRVIIEVPLDQQRS